MPTIYISQKLKKRIEFFTIYQIKLLTLILEAHILYCNDKDKKNYRKTISDELD